MSSCCGFMTSTTPRCPLVSGSCVGGGSASWTKSSWQALWPGNPLSSSLSATKSTTIAPSSCTLKRKPLELVRADAESRVLTRDFVGALRAKIANAAGERTLFVNPNTAPYCHKALATGTLKKGSSFLEEDSEYQHVGTAIRYFIDYEFPIRESYNRPLQLKGGL